MIGKIVSMRWRNVRTLLQAVSVLALVAFACAPPSASAERRLAADPRGEIYAPASFTPIPVVFGSMPERNARAFQQDNLWTDGGDQYAVWIDAAGSPLIGKRRHASSSWETYDLSLIPGNPLQAPTAEDEHNVYAVAVDADGFIHVAGNMHADSLRYVRSRAPRDISSWTRGTMVGSQEKQVTYPTFVRRRDGSLLYLYRDGGSGHGDLVANVLVAGASVWKRIGTIIDGRSSGESPYLNHVAVDPRTGIIHVLYVWRGTPAANTNNDVSYARSHDGGKTWTRSDGTTLPSPITHATSEVVLDTPDTDSGLSNAGGLAVDTTGRPHGAVLLSNEQTPNAVIHVWYDGHAWQSETVVDRSVGRLRPAVIASDDGRVFVLHVDYNGASAGTAWLIEVTTGAGTTSQPVPLFRVGVPKWEPGFDTQASITRQELHVLSPGAPPGCADSPGGQARCAPASIVTLKFSDLRVDESPEPEPPKPPEPPNPPDDPNPRLRDISETCARRAGQGSFFTDMDHSAHRMAVACLSDWGVATGSGDQRFKPGQLLTREQASSFVARVIKASGGTLPPATKDYFVDDAGSAHEAAINQLAQAEILRGRGQTFRPKSAMSRGQMVTMLTAALQHQSMPLRSAEQDFFHDDDASVHHDNINVMAENGIVGGVAAGRFDPVRAVTRGQMASFTARALDAAVKSVEAAAR